jgi:hypothetical protein
MSSKDFTNIQVGDTVMVCSAIGRSLARVAKVTKTQFAIKSGPYSLARFMRSSGSEYGGDAWHGKWAFIPDDNDIAAVKAEQRQDRAVSEARRLRNQIDTALNMITGRRAQGWGPTLEASNDHLRRALEALQLKQEELL